MTTDEPTDAQLQFLTTKEVCSLLLVNRAKIYEAIELGHLKCARVGPRTFRFRRQDVAEYQEGLVSGIFEKPAVAPAPLVKGSGRRRNAAA